MEWVSEERHNRWATIFLCVFALCVDIVESWCIENEKRMEKNISLYGEGILTDTNFSRALFYRCVSLRIATKKNDKWARSVWENRKWMSSIFRSFDKMRHIIHHKMMTMMLMMMRLKFPKSEQSVWELDGRELGRSKRIHAVRSVFGRLTFWAEW